MSSSVRSPRIWALVTAWDALPAPEPLLWRWRMNVPALLAGIDTITGWPEPPAGARYLGPSLFLHGGESGYVQPAHEPAIRALFPYARFRSVPGAGHWVYADRPAEFLAALRAFLA